MKKIIGSIVFVTILFPCTGVMGNIKKEAEALVAEKTKEQLNTMSEFFRTKQEETKLEREQVKFKKEKLRQEEPTWRSFLMQTGPEVCKKLVTHGLPTLMAFVLTCKMLPLMK